MSQYHDAQAKISSKKAELEVELISEQDKLAKAEQTRVEAINNKKGPTLSNKNLLRE